MDTEHIYIGDEIADLAEDPQTVCRKARIRNRVNGVRTDLVFYAEGHLKVREESKKAIDKEHMIELRFLAHDPVVCKHFALPLLWTSLALGLLALAVSTFLPMTALATHTIAATASLATIAVLALLLFVYRSEETHRFYTASGRAPVIRLTGSIGCIRLVRKVSKAISAAIAEASGGYDQQDVRYLRAEMKAHYKLAEAGVITREACSNGTSTILSKFD